jgi:hypothetical protein
MSCACGLKEYGREILFFVSDFAICGVKEEVAHVSRTFSSGIVSPPHFGHIFFYF